jgi:RHS repeat-associated protein
VAFLQFDKQHRIVTFLDKDKNALTKLHYVIDDMGFISTDPHYYNYPSSSPYAYCGNNPIMKTDPTGMDEWEIDGQGKIVNQIQTDKHDAFFMVDKDGNRIDGKSISFSYGTVKQTYSTDIRNDTYEIKSNSNSAQLFEFLADNTSVEWANVQFFTDKSFLVTSHEKSKVYGTALRYMQTMYPFEPIQNFTHSHPRGTPYPSGLRNRTSDIGVATQLEKYNSLMKSYIYLPGVGKGVRENYIEYNSNSLSVDFRGHPDYTPPVIVYGTKK